MPSCKITRYRVSHWTKGYNKGKINVVIETDTGNIMLIENLTPEHGNFLLNLFSSPGDLSCDPESNEGLMHLTKVVGEHQSSA